MLFNRDDADGGLPAHDDKPARRHPADPSATPGELHDAGTGEVADVGGDRWYRRARFAFRQWRRTRPFWAGLLCLLGGLLMAYGPLRGIRFVLVAGTVVWAGILVGLLVSIMGLFLWFAPQIRQLTGVLAAVLSIVSLITSNLGGYLIGLILGVLGGAMGFAWTPLTSTGGAHGHRAGGAVTSAESTRTGQQASGLDPGQHRGDDARMGRYGLGAR